MWGIMKKITIEDIAKDANVSIKTVSRVFNHEPNVRDETRKRVLEVAEALNYRPNLSARSLASNKSFIIVHFHDNPNPDYIDRINQGLHKACRSAGYFSVNEPLPLSDDSYAALAATYLTSFHVDGALLSPPLCDDPALLAVLREKNVPYTRISPMFEKHKSGSTYIDDKAASTMMTNHLIDLGHKRIAFIAGPASHGSTSERTAGFLNALESSNLSVQDCPQYSGDFSFRSGFEAGQKIIESGHNASAIFAANDEMAVGAMMATMKAGLDIPADMSIAGFDGSRIGDILWPQLTTIRQPIRKLSERATNILLTSLRSSELDIVCEELPVTLLARGSSAKPKD